MAEEQEPKQERVSSRHLLLGLNVSLHHLNKLLKKANLHRISYFSFHPLKFLMFNFLLGIFRGLGIAIGMTLVFALLVYIFSKILTPVLSLPVIGQFVAEIIKIVEGQLGRGVRIR